MNLYEATGKPAPKKCDSFVTDIETDTVNNANYRKVLHTTKLSQLVLMSLKPGEDIGMETHKNGDQFIRIDSGSGKVILDGKEHSIKDGSAMVIAAGTEHNIINTSDSEDLKLYAVYTPPEHKAGTIDKDKSDED
jgi:mannose-6-phosphate isomerase-like protein (cupin superfamily)